MLRRKISYKEVEDFFGIPANVIRYVELKNDARGIQFKVEVFVLDENKSRIYDQRGACLTDTLSVAIVNNQEEK